MIHRHDKDFKYGKKYHALCFPQGEVTFASRVGISAGKKCFLSLAGFNRFKPAKSGRKWQK